MSSKKWQKLVSGWFPQGPTLVLRGTEDKKKLFNWALVPFLAPGALMIIAAVLSADTGLGFVSIFPNLFPSHPGAMVYTILYLGIANVAAAILGLISGRLLLEGKRIRISIACLVTVLSLGLASPIFPALDGQPWQIGSTVSTIASQSIAPMTVLPAIVLALIGINYKKLKSNTGSKITIQKKQVPNFEPLTIGVAAAGCALLFSVITGSIIWPIYYMQQTEFFTNGASPSTALILVVAITLLLTSFSMRTVQKHRFINGSPLKEADFHKQLFRALLIANSIMIIVFFAANLLIQPPPYFSIKTNLLQWSIFLPTMLAVNALIFRQCRRHLLN